MSFQVIFALTASVAAAVMDISTGKVYNWWICILWSAGMMYHIIFGGWTGVGEFLAGSTIPILILFPLFHFRMLGPGDIKMFSALGGVMGAGSVLVCIAVSFLCGGILSIGILLMCGNLIPRLRYFTEYIHNFINNKKTVPYYTTGPRMENFHFTVAILMGTVIYAGGFY